MLSIETITPEQVILILCVAVALLGISWLFNNYIDAQTETDPLGSNSAVYTVLGTAYTLLGALGVLAILFGWLTALFVVGVVLVCFAASGTPMIFGDMRRGSKRRRAELQRAKQHEREE